MAPTGSLLWRYLRGYQIYGANTDVGKTVFSTILCKTSKKAFPDERISFIKPVSTGPLTEADDRHVSLFAPKVVTKCLFQFEKPVSPHIAAAVSSTVGTVQIVRETPSDEHLLSQIYNCFSECAQAGRGWAFLETAGGVHSPGPSSISQADLYRPLRLPVVLVADSHLGGISSTISAFESLKMRGYDVEAVMLFQDSIYQNDDYLRSYFAKLEIPSLALPPPPERNKSSSDDKQSMADYYERMSHNQGVHHVLSHLSKKHDSRVERLESMANRAHDCIWYPFTQHKLLSPTGITTIDSASGDFFQIFQPQTTPLQESSSIQNTKIPTQIQENSLIKPAFDGSASWWTQGLGHANPTLTLSAAYAAGRYGHVMFAEAIHEPALSLAELLLQKLNNPRLKRVFYSDDGSTGIEVAVKMGLRAARVRYGWDASEELGILGLKGSYHGDTIGAMDCAEPCIYNEKVEWYSGKGFWFDYPTIRMTKGQWIVDIPKPMQDMLGSHITFGSLREIFDLESREEGAQEHLYGQFITSVLEKLHAEGRKFGALMLEPIILGAGGMLFVDPLFQRTLVQVIRQSPHLFGTVKSEGIWPESSPTTWTGLPVIFDEVFTGLYRLGRISSASFLGINPDISIHAKLLTGGVVPLCTTLASDSISKAFSSPDKSDALLHGHSYTAHAVGCQVALASVKTMIQMEEAGAWDEYRRDWFSPSASPSGQTQTSNLETPSTRSNTSLCIDTEIWSIWSHSFITDLSHSNRVDGVFAIGSVLAINLRDSAGKTGYSSNAARSLQQSLLLQTTSTTTSQSNKPAWNIHSRVLGNVLYLMASQTSKTETIRTIERLVFDTLAGAG
ncbi:MAG: hypothetical protein M1834_003246 [Cirrosporium novae-zelandiae]|nr:MAG: hypothetical protein M1834_003246 [Cirrosporium novae-zelandiae]